MDDRDLTQSTLASVSVGITYNADNLPADYFDQYKAGMNESMIRSRILGEYAVGEDRVLDMAVPDAGAFAL